VEDKNYHIFKWHCYQLYISILPFGLGVLGMVPVMVGRDPLAIERESGLRDGNRSESCDQELPNSQPSTLVVFWISSFGFSENVAGVTLESDRECFKKKIEVPIEKQMRLGPATQAALLSRMFLTAVFRRCERSSRNRTPGSAMHRFSLRLTLQGRIRRFHPPWKKDFMRRLLSPGTGTLDMRRISPDDSLSRSPATSNPCRNRFRTSHAFDCKHFAGVEGLTQRQTAASLCKNCGGMELPVEEEG